MRVSCWFVIPSSGWRGRFSVSRSPAGPHGDAATILFNESQSRIIISVLPEKLDNAVEMLREHGVPFQQLGEVGGNELQIRIHEQMFRWPVAELYDDWWNTIGRAVEEEETIPSL